MKRHLLPLIIVLLPLAATVLWAWTPRTLSPDQASDLYRRYEHNPHLAVTYLRNFPLADTLAVDVTTIQALDDEGWDTLVGDFHILPLPESIQKKIDDGKDIVSVRLTPKMALGHSMDTTDLLKNNVIGISRKNRTVSIFKTDSEDQQDAVSHYNYRKGY